VVEKYTYDAYGTPVIRNASGAILTAIAITNPHMFTGRRLDSETGLYHYRNRVYSPVIGRFLQRDPIGYFDSMNLFVYVRNNTVNLVDPEGLSSIIFGRPWWMPRVGPRGPINYPKPPGWNSSWQWRYPAAKTRPSVGPRWFDPKGGEWRWHAPDKYHPKGHWDYNPWDKWNSEWQNIDPAILPPIIDPGGSSNNNDSCSENAPPIDLGGCFAAGLCA
jgi:RHS repeat-associated protein